MIRERIQEFMEENLDDLQADIIKLSSKERIKVFMELLPYVAPKMSPSPDFDLSKLTDEQLDRLAEHLINRSNQ